jgi:hypothetical protein
LLLLQQSAHLDLQEAAASCGLHFRCWLAWECSCRCPAVYLLLHLHHHRLLLLLLQLLPLQPPPPLLLLLSLQR